MPARNKFYAVDVAQSMVVDIRDMFGKLKQHRRLDDDQRRFGVCSGLTTGRPRKDEAKRAEPPFRPLQGAR